MPSLEEVKRLIQTNVLPSTKCSYNGTPCLIWQGRFMRTNIGIEYAVICFEGKDTLVHRLVLFIKNKKWPDSTDHLCANTLCINELHLEDTTQTINTQRAFARRGRKQLCKRGHKMTPENSKIHISGRGYITINCRECDKLRKRLSYNLKTN